MEQIKLEEKELKEIQTIKEDNSSLTIDFGKIKLDLIMVKAKLMELEKLESDMEAKFKGNMTKERKTMDKLNKKYGEGSIDLANGIFTPTTKIDGEEKR
jgi:regulator of replication initiation timing